MDFKKGFASGVFSLSIVALIFSVVTTNPSDAASEGMSGHGSMEKSDKSSRIEDAHRRFRDGSAGGMMGAMMGKHGSSKSSSHGSSTGGASPHGKKSGHGKGMSSSSHGGRSALFSAAGLKGTLGLDEKQTAAIKGVLSEYRKATILTKAHLRVAQMELDEAVADAGFKVSDIEGKAKKREAIATELTMVRVKALAGARGVLKADQFKTFMGLLVNHMSSHGQKGKRSGHSGRGSHGSSGSKHSGMGSSHGGGSSHSGSTRGYSGMMGSHGSSSAHGKSGGSSKHHESISHGEKSTHGYDR